MGLNAQTTVPAFTAGQVLTAAQQNNINTGIPVFADSTARDAAFGGTGEKTLAEGQYAYLESTKQTLVYDGSNWVSVGVTPGIVLVSATTIGSGVASVTVSSAFSATYDNYYITVSGGVASTQVSMGLTLGATTTGYYWAGYQPSYTSTAYDGSAGANEANFGLNVRGSVNSLNGQIWLYEPFAAKNTHFSSIASRSTTTADVFNASGYLADTTSYTAFTLTPNSGTITGGTIRVYGYANS